MNKSDTAFHFVDYIVYDLVTFFVRMNVDFAHFPFKSCFGRSRAQKNLPFGVLLPPVCR